MKYAHMIMCIRQRPTYNNLFCVCEIVYAEKSSSTLKSLFLADFTSPLLQIPEPVNVKIFSIVEVLKDKFTQKWKLSHHFHTPMQSQGKFHSPQNISG